MFVDLSLLAMVPILAEALITWTAETYYVATAIFHVAVIVGGFKVLQVDPEHNTIIGGVVAAVIIAAVGYFTRDAGLIGTLLTGGAIFGILLAISAGDALKALVVACVIVASYGGFGWFVVDRTPLTVDSIGGLTRVVIRGELDSEPLQSEDDLYEHTKQKIDDADEDDEFE